MSTTQQTDPLAEQTGDVDAMEVHDALDAQSEEKTEDELLDEAALPGDPLTADTNDLERELGILSVAPPTVAVAGDDAAATVVSDDDDDDDDLTADPDAKTVPKKSAYMVSQELIDKPLSADDLMDPGEI